MEVELTSTQVIDSIVSRINFIMLRLTASGANINTEVINSLAKEMLLDYGLSEDQLEPFIRVINDLNIFCDSVIDVVEKQSVEGGEPQDVLLNGREIRIC